MSHMILHLATLFISFHYVQPSAYSSVWKEVVTQNNIGDQFIFQSHLNKDSSIYFYVLCEAKQEVHLSVQWILREEPCNQPIRVADFYHLNIKEAMAESTKKKQEKQPEPAERIEFNVQQSEPKIITCGKTSRMIHFQDQGGEPYFHGGFIKGQTFMKKIFRNSSEKEVKNRIAKTWDAGVYSLGVKITFVDMAYSLPADTTAKIRTDKEFAALLKVRMDGPHGLLPAMQFPMLPFSGVMALFYLVVSTGWIILWMRNFKHTVSFHMILGVIAVAGAFSYTFEFIDLMKMNNDGLGQYTVMWAASGLSAMQGALFAALLMAVSVGYGINRPELGWCYIGTIASLGTLKFSTQMALVFMQNFPVNSPGKQWHYLLLNIVVVILLALVNLVIGIWIGIASGITLYHIVKRQHSKRLLPFTVFFITAVISCVCLLAFGVLSILPQATHLCSSALWKYVWIAQGGWGLSTFFLLLVVMWLWLPGDNERFYAFNPIVDQEAAEDEEEEVILDKIKLEKMRLSEL